MKLGGERASRFASRKTQRPPQKGTELITASSGGTPRSLGDPMFDDV